VAIIGVLLGVGIPALQQMILRSQLEGAVRQTSTMMVGARFQAIKTGDPVIVQIDTATNEILSFVDSDASGVFEVGERMLQVAQLGSGVSFEAPPTEAVIDGFTVVGSVGTAQFDSDGSAAATGAFRFADARGNFMEVRVEPRASAKVQLQKWDEDEGEFLAQGEKGKTWVWGS